MAFIVGEMEKVCRCAPTRMEIVDDGPDWMETMCQPFVEENFGEPKESPPVRWMKSKEEFAAELREQYRTESKRTLLYKQKELESEWKHSQEHLFKLRKEAVPPEAPEEPDWHDQYLQNERRRRLQEHYDRFQMDEMRRRFHTNVTKVRSNAHEPRKYFLSHSHKERAPEELCPHLGDKRRRFEQKVRGVKDNMKDRIESLTDMAVDAQHEIRYLSEVAMGRSDP